MIKKQKQGTLLLRARVRARQHPWRQILSGGFCMRHVMNALRRIFCFIRHDMRTHAQQKQYVNERKETKRTSLWFG